MAGPTDIITTLAGIVAGLTPRTMADRGFAAAESVAGGFSRDVIDDPSRGRTRSFAVRLSDDMPKDDGAAGTPGLRLRATFEIKVLYLAADFALPAMQAAMSEDAGSIIRATQSVAAWDTSTTGIVSVVPGEQPTREPAEQDTDSGTRTIGQILTIPLPVIYREAP